MRKFLVVSLGIVLVILGIISIANQCKSTVKGPFVQWDEKVCVIAGVYKADWQATVAKEEAKGFSIPAKELKVIAYNHNDLYFVGDWPCYKIRISTPFYYGGIEEVSYDKDIRRVIIHYNGIDSLWIILIMFSGIILIYYFIRKTCLRNIKRKSS